MIRVIAVRTFGQDLRPGDLFSTVGREYWDGFPIFQSIGERVYIRTFSPTPQADANEEVYRIVIIEEPS
jgi:hypothetical protein